MRFLRSTRVSRGMLAEAHNLPLMLLPASSTVAPRSVKGVERRLKAAEGA